MNSMLIFGLKTILGYTYLFIHVKNDAIHVYKNSVGTTHIVKRYFLKYILLLETFSPKQVI